MTKRSATEAEIRRLNQIARDFLRDATSNKMPAPDSRVRTFIGDRRLRVVRDESADRRSFE